MSTCTFRLMIGMKWREFNASTCFSLWCLGYKIWTKCQVKIMCSHYFVTGNVSVKNCWSAEQQASIRKMIVVCLRNKIQGIRLVLPCFVSPRHVRNNDVSSGRCRVLLDLSAPAQLKHRSSVQQKWRQAGADVSLITSAAQPQSIRPVQHSSFSHTSEKFVLKF